jgi:hypothetical protein
MSITREVNMIAIMMLVSIFFNAGWLSESLAPAEIKGLSGSVTVSSIQYVLYYEPGISKYNACPTGRFRRWKPGPLRTHSRTSPADPGGGGAGP